MAISISLAALAAAGCSSSAGTVTGASGGSGSGATASTSSGSRTGSSSGSSRVVSNAEIVLMAELNLDAGPQGSEIVTMNLDGGNWTRITNNDLLEFLPHFSPDGTRLVYTRFTTGYYGSPGATTEVVVYDFTTGTESQLTDGGTAYQPVWSPDGTRIAFLRPAVAELWMMNADGSNARRVAAASGAPEDRLWGDIAWSRDDWILFVVGGIALYPDGGSCFKTRLDEIRPDGGSRTQVDEGGPSCTPAGMEQSGDADPGFSADGQTIFSSRGFPVAPANGPAGTTERKLYSLSSDAWSPGKVETDLSLPSEPDCIEGVPKGSPDGSRVLLFRQCFYSPNEPGGVFVTDTAGSYRTLVYGAGRAGPVGAFGPDWNPVFQSASP